MELAIAAATIEGALSARPQVGCFNGFCFSTHPFTFILFLVRSTFKEVGMEETGTRGVCVLDCVDGGKPRSAMEISKSVKGKGVNSSLIGVNLLEDKL